jgi:hypothetical protein
MVESSKVSTVAFRVAAPAQRCRPGRTSHAHNGRDASGRMGCGTYNQISFFHIAAASSSGGIYRMRHAYPYGRRPPLESSTPERVQIGRGYGGFEKPSKRLWGRRTRPSPRKNRNVAERRRHGSSHSVLVTVYIAFQLRVGNGFKSALLPGPHPDLRSGPITSIGRRSHVIKRLPFPSRWENETGREGAEDAGCTARVRFARTSRPSPRADPPQACSPTRG